MVSPYSPNQPIATCQRCGTPLIPGETRCRTCGYQQNMPQPGFSEQHQAKGLLSRYSEGSPRTNSDGYQEQQNIAHTAFPARQWSLKTSFEQNSHYQPFPTAAPQALLTQEQSSTREKQRPNTGMIAGIVLLLVALIGGGVLAYLYFAGKPDSTTSVKATIHQVVATPTSQPLFSDNFTDNAHQWSLQSYPGQFSVSLQNSSLILESDNNRLLWEPIPGNQKYGDFQLMVDAVLSKGSQDNGYGVYIRSSLDQNGAFATYYRFELYGDGTFAVFKSGSDANAAPTRLVNYTATSAIQKQGAVNHITILAQGSKLQLSVNGSVLSTISDSIYSSGTIALFVSNLQNAPAGTQAQFSHLAIYPVQ